MQIQRLKGALARGPVQRVRDLPPKWLGRMEIGLHDDPRALVRGLLLCLH